MSDTTPSSERTRKSTRRLVKVVLTLSLTLNLLVLGLVVGAHVRDGHDDRRFEPPAKSMVRDMGFGPFIGAFPRDHRRAMAEALRDRAGPFLDSRKAMDDDMRQILTLLRAEPFDAEALNAVLAAQGERIRSRAEIGREVLVDQVAAMSARDRAQFADNLERGLRDSMERIRSDWRDRRDGSDRGGPDRSGPGRGDRSRDGH